MDDLSWCIEYLKKYNKIKSIFDMHNFNTFRGLMNITYPLNLSDEYYFKQDLILKSYFQDKKIIDIDSLEHKNNIYLYKGDITLLKVDCIVNACNNKLLGCFYPLHNCIDNAIHSFAGLQVRRDLMKIMEKQNHDEENGKCKVTKAYNLNSLYIFHTVGPMILNKVSLQDEIDLQNCYLSCLNKALEYKLSSIAFPCISTGVYNFPKEQALNIAYQTVNEFIKKNKSNLKVVFVTFKNDDYLMYQRKIF